MSLRRHHRRPRLTREEGKLRTRRALVDSALALMGENRSFTSLSLREVARNAVVQPMLDAAVDILDVPSRRPELETELVDRFVRYLVVVFLGAQAWRDKR